MDGTERRKLEALLGYWVKHNREHGEEFKEWANKAADAGEALVHDHILQAAQEMDEANKSLLKALDALKKM
jgi:hypothetical protein